MGKPDGRFVVVDFLAQRFKLRPPLQRLLISLLDIQGEEVAARFD